MRSLALLLLTLVCAAALVNAYTLAYKAKKLSSTPRTGSVLQLDTASYNVLTEAPRNYSIVVLLTALSSSIGCAVCREFDPEYLLAANSFTALKSDYPLYFGSLDFSVGREIYVKYGLQSAPNVYYFPATEGPHKQQIATDFVNYELNRRGVSSVDLAKWLSSETGQKIHIVRPTDYTKLAFTVGVLVCIAATARLLYRGLSIVLTNKHLWAFTSILTILLMNSGFMWNRIRNPPFVTNNQQGHVQYIADGFQQQYGIETQISATLNGICALCVVVLTVGVPKLQSVSQQRIAIIILLGCLIVTYSMLIRVFRMKNGGYPFRLLL